VAAVDQQLDVQAVVLQQHGGGGGGLAVVTRELRRVGQAGLATVMARDQGAVLHRIAHHGRVRPVRQRHRLVQEGFGPGHHLGAASRVEAFAAGGAIGIIDRVGAVQRVIQAAPPRIGCVQGVTRVADRHHQLRPGDGGDFGVHVCGGDTEGRRLRQEITDAAQEALIGRLVVGGALVFVVPGIDLRLQLVPPGQQGFVAGREIVQQRGKPGPEGVGGDTGARQRLGLEEGGERRSDVQAVDRCAAHGYPPC
jgi:hypothetical protein